MPCYDPPETQYEIDERRRRWREQMIREGRWDELATREELAGWLCDTLRGTPPTPELLRWWEAHKKFHDAERKHPTP